MADWQGTFLVTNTTTQDNDNCEQNNNLESMTEKFQALQKREAERLAQVQKKKEENESQNLSVQQSLQLFLDSFNSELKTLEDVLLNSSSIAPSGLVNHFDDLSQRTHKLQRVVSESTMFLPPYELKKAQNLIVSLQSRIQEKRDELIPKRKFAFKMSNKRMEKKAAPINVAKFDQIDEAKPSKSEDDMIIELAACKFVGFSNETLEKYSEDIDQKDVAIAELNDCVVRLFGAPSAVHINKLKNCKIFSGPVSGSIFIRECTNCTFVLPCHQLRIHSTANSHFYIHVTSKAIVEDCNNVKFAPYSWDYKNLDEHFVKSGLMRDRNNWDKVDDFNWLVANEQSPNWSVLKESERIY